MHDLIHTECPEQTNNGGRMEIAVVRLGESEERRAAA